MHLEHAPRGRSGALLTGIVAALLAAVACPLPSTDGRDYPCSSAADCAEGWSCHDGLCRKLCEGDGDCPARTPVCAAGICLADDGNVGLSSSSSSGVIVSSSSSSSGEPSSSSTSSSGSVSGTSSSSGVISSSSTSSSSSGGTLPTRDLWMTAGGGGRSQGQAHDLQMCVGEAVVSGPVANGNGAILSVGLFSTLEVR
ncbi:MAG: hypothetical protein AB2A00_32495 [Myxococcota bacterium]